MHGSSLLRMEWFVKTYLSTADRFFKVLDVGSCDVSGGTYKQFFNPQKYEYCGLDMSAGPNVDIVPKYPYQWAELKDNFFDVVISGQAFEHIEFFWLTALEMTRVLKPEGLLCIIAPRGFERHRHPVDCYRFDADGMIAVARWCNLDILHASTDMEPADAAPGWHIENMEDSILIAKKPVDWAGPINHKDYIFSQPHEITGSFVPCKKIDYHAQQIQYLQEKYEMEKAALIQENEKKRLEIINDFENQKKIYENGMQQLMADANELSQKIKSYENSNSWRITAPLRICRKFLKKVLKRHPRIKI